MTDNNHPISVPPKLVKQMAAKSGTHCFFPYQDLAEHCQSIADQAARWGYEQRGAVNEAKLQKARDEELEACCEYIAGPGSWFANPEHRVAELRAARRTNPPSLKEQALAALNEADQGLNESEWQQRSDTIRRALEALDD